MAKTRECCSTLSLRRTGDDLHVSLHKGFKIQLTGIVPVTSEFTDDNTLEIRGRFWVKFQGVEVVFCLEIPRGGVTFSVNFQGVETVFCLEIPRGGV